MADNFISDFMGELNHDFNQIVEKGNEWNQANEVMHVQQFDQTNFVSQYSLNDVYVNQQTNNQSNQSNFNNQSNMLNFNNNNIIHHNQIIPDDYMATNDDHIQQAYHLDLSSAVPIVESQSNQSISYNNTNNNNNNIQQGIQPMLTNHIKRENDMDTNKKIRKNLKELLKNDTNVKQIQSIAFSQDNQQLFNFNNTIPKLETGYAKQKSRSINSIINSGGSMQKNTLKNLLNKPNPEVKHPVLVNPVNLNAVNTFQQNQQGFTLEKNIVTICFLFLLLLFY